jgi:hypothetical protein
VCSSNPEADQEEEPVQQRNGDGMSRYEFTDGDVNFTVGWDVPLQTFFIQIYNDEGEVTTWLGTHPGEIPTMDKLMDELYGRMIMPSDMVLNLLEEESKSNEKPTALQQYVNSIFKEVENG